MAKKIAVIGAGISGLAVALNLDRDQFDVTIFEKQRGYGGRVVTRSRNNYEFDFGAQYIEETENKFSLVLEDWLDQDIIKPWNATIGELHGINFEETFHDKNVFVGTPTMNAIPKYLANRLVDCKKYNNIEINKMLKKFNSWHLWDQYEEVHGPYDFVIIAVPAPKAKDLVSDYGHLLSILNKSSYSSRWAVMLGFKHGLKMQFDAAFVSSNKIRWLARNNSKPERPDLESWVLHASKEWSDNNQDADNAWIEDQLFDEFKEISGFIDIHPQYIKAHHFKYASVDINLDMNFLIDSDRKLALCGDYFLGNNIEAAYMSGQGLGKRLSSQLY